MNYIKRIVLSLLAFTIYILRFRKVCLIDLNRVLMLSHKTKIHKAGRRLPARALTGPIRFIIIYT